MARQQQQQHQHQHQHHHYQQQQHQHMLQAVPATPQPSMYNNNCKPSVHTVHQSGAGHGHGRSTSPQMMPVHAPPLSPPPLVHHNRHMQPHMQMQHPSMGMMMMAPNAPQLPGLGMPALNHPGYDGHGDGHNSISNNHRHHGGQRGQHQCRGRQGASSASVSASASVYPRHRLQAHA